MLTPDEFRARVERHLAKTGLKPAVFGRQAVHDPNFVYDLRAGREPRSRVVQRVLAFMERDVNSHTLDAA